MLLVCTWIKHTGLSCVSKVDLHAFISGDERAKKTL